MLLIMRTNHKCMHSFFTFSGMQYWPIWVGLIVLVLVILAALEMNNNLSCFMSFFGFSLWKYQFSKGFLLLVC